VTSYPKRLIEVDLPIKKISKHARREALGRWIVGKEKGVGVLEKYGQKTTNFKK
jgi:hypothetical protein